MSRSPAARAATPLEIALPHARRGFAEFVAALPVEGPVVVFCDADADGLCAGALLARALPRTDPHDVRVLHARRGESPFSEQARRRLRAEAPGALVAADLGVRADGLLRGVPTAYIDHHRPSGEPAGAVVISGYGWDPIPATSWLTYELLDGLADVEDLSWLAAAGTIGDLGEDAPWPELPRLRRRWTSKWLREAVSLINAARRASGFDVDTPLRMLMTADHPRRFGDADVPEVAAMHAYRDEVKRELAKARRQPPRFSTTGPYALVRIHSKCQIHPLIAQLWRGRLHDRAIIAANTGYLPGVVAFSMRTVRTDLNLPQLLRSMEPDDFGGRFGHGHDRASGGHLPPDRFARLLLRLGFAAADIP